MKMFPDASIKSLAAVSDNNCPVQGRVILVLKKRYICIAGVFFKYVFDVAFMSVTSFEPLINSLPLSILLKMHQNLSPHQPLSLIHI